MSITISSAPSPLRARIATAVFFFVSGFGFSTWASRIPTIQQHLGLNEAQLGGVLLALPAGLMLTLPVTGVLLQRHSSRNIMLVGAILYNLMLGTLGFVAHTWQLVLVLFCFGCSRNLLNISVNAQSVGVQGLYSRPILATFHGVWSVAGFAAAGVSALLIPANVSLPYHMVIVSVLLTAVAFSFFSGTLTLQPKPQAQKTGFALPDKTLLRFGAIAFTSMACEGTMYDWSSIYFAKAVHAPKELVAAGYTAYMVAMTTGRFSGDWLVSRLGIRNMLRYSGFLMSLGLLLAALFPMVIPSGLGFVMVGLGVSCVVPLVFGMAGKSSNLGSGSAIAAVSTVGYFGFLIVPPVVGFVAEAASLRWSLGLMSVLGAVMMGMVWRLKEPT
ncbi:MFS transporter [Hymenobacter sp. GOD-10R]|uniref:MFS transporter n=1 Tax=Hymenobacter sp. GOD-10R TaxID=3093922 RepID=UPI002D76DDB1|nr:MFS transporter [Hymenobacter sp. GOD-10R]WRQ29023.1 MFS transporter [Hymenobacter sp. GOD-10R]